MREQTLGKTKIPKESADDFFLTENDLLEWFSKNPDLGAFWENAYISSQLNITWKEKVMMCRGLIGSRE